MQGHLQTSHKDIMTGVAKPQEELKKNDVNVSSECAQGKKIIIFDLKMIWRPSLKMLVMCVFIMEDSVIWDLLHASSVLSFDVS